MDYIPKINLKRQLPCLDELLNHSSLTYYIEAYSLDRVKNKAREALEDIETKIDNDLINSINIDEIVFSIINKLSKDFSLSLKPVINATGIVLNQYLGRAPLSEEIISHIVNTSVGYCNLDYDLTRGTKINRLFLLNKLICQITGAESAIVVNNNAAALLLIANTFAKDKEIVISRGEIVEIEDEFRITDIIYAANSELVEVGTTNRSLLKDYQTSISENTSIILKVHTSSYYIKGYTSKVELFALVDLAKTKNLLSVVDIGTGLLIDLSKYGLPYEPTIDKTLKTGVDLITFSGDKLFGGPQAGIILGKKEYIDQLAKNPIIRTLRPDKFTLSALEATLQVYLNPEKSIENIPTLKMLTKKIIEIENDANLIYEEIKHFYTIECGVKKHFSAVGGNILPEVNLPTYVVWIKHKQLDSCTLHNKFLDHSVVTLIKDNMVLIDPRCFIKRDFKLLSMIFEQVFK
ncbi:MAG: L-seryl-tRNA(Sec) selenium transferase [Cyanobacteriota bacterium]